ncbi:MAG: flagellar motor switch protein FliN [Gammaproteobacteria bacterium]|nr:flagellar motor switch protein FliN [Gammaproteobacteria bacterium]
MSVDETTADTEAVPDEWAAALAEQADTDAAKQPEAGEPVVEAAAASVAPSPPPEVKKTNYARAEFQELDADEPLSSAGGDEANLEVILDIPVTLSMEIGRTKISIRNLLKLNQGSVVELDRLAGEPMDVLVNNCLVAHGEVVVVNDKFGIRLTDVISAAERVKKLR